MDCQDYITESVERKKEQHLQREERGAIQHLKNAGYSGAKFSPFIILFSCRMIARIKSEVP